jgi:ketosteroid isomerase-like protein
MHRSRFDWLWACIVAGSFGIAIAVSAQTTTNSASDSAAIRAAAKEYILAVRSGDENAIRKMWAPEGDYIDASGRIFKPHALASAQGVQPAAAAQSPAAPMPDSTLRFITPDVAIEDGTTTGDSEIEDSSVMGRYTAVWVKRNGKWLLDSLRESMVTSPAINEHLRPLDWLIGEWIGTTDNAVVLASSRWSQRGDYIVRKFIVRRNDGETVSGSERIGWDSTTNQIKSWTFDSQGNSGETQWRRDGNRWVVTADEVGVDGTQSKTSATYLPRDRGVFVWEVAASKVAGRDMPAQRIEFRRASEND